MGPYKTNRQNCEGVVFKDIFGVCSHYREASQCPSSATCQYAVYTRDSEGDLAALFYFYPKNDQLMLTHGSWSPSAAALLLFRTAYSIFLVCALYVYLSLNISCGVLVALWSYFYEWLPVLFILCIHMRMHIHDRGIQSYQGCHTIPLINGCQDI